MMMSGVCMEVLEGAERGTGVGASAGAGVGVGVEVEVSEGPRALALWDPKIVIVGSSGFQWFFLM